MTNEEWEELLNSRYEELISAIKTLNLTGEQSFNDCKEAVKGVIGIRLLDDSGCRVRNVAASLYWLKHGSMTLDEAVTHLNNLPLGLRIAELQRAEVLEAEPELAEALETETTNDNSPMKKEHWDHFVNLKPDDYNYEDLDSDADFFKAEVAPDAKSLEQLCEAYEEGLATGDYPPDVVDYVCALEDLVSEMQGKSFKDGSMIGQLMVESAALKVRLNGGCSYSKFFSYKETEAFNDLHDEFFKNVSEKLFSDEEKLLRTLITKHIHDWDGSIESLIGRLNIVHRLRDISKTVVIDGKPVAVIYGPSYQVQGSKYLGLIQYKELNES
ncbi:hypothetical protein [Shewanella sp. Koi 1]